VHLGGHVLVVEFFVVCGLHVCVGVDVDVVVVANGDVGHLLAMVGQAAQGDPLPIGGSA
jgi:hypothetical protein